ncbi:MAG: hypothetical protein V7641_4727 [Blastocatellia bacterium]
MSQSLDRLYELLPAVYRLRDAEQGYPLRALLQVIAEQVNVVEEDIAQLYENWFIETCEDWVVPYIGDLIGYVAVTQLGNQGGGNSSLNRILIPRRDVADAIRNRRRKGTLSLIEEATADVSGWPARVVEFYKRLGWTQPLNHLRLRRGQTANLRNGNALDLLGGAFDSVAHMVDVRRVASSHSEGRYNIPSVAAFVWRLKAYSVTYSSAHCLDEIGPHAYTFNTLGHNMQLYNRPQPEPAPTHIAEELNLPVPIRRRAFEERVTQDGRTRTQASAAYYGADDNRVGRSLALWVPDWPDKQSPQPVPREKIIPADLRKWRYRAPRNHVAVDPVLGRIVFPPSQLPKRGVKVSYHYAFSADIGGGEYARQLSQPEKYALYHVSKRGGKEKSFKTINEALNQWIDDKTRERDKPDDDPTKDVRKYHSAVIEITDSDVYTEHEPLMIELERGESLQIRAASGVRPVIKILDYTEGMDALFISGRRGSRFKLDGIVVSGRGIRVDGREVDNGEEGSEPPEYRTEPPYEYGQRPPKEDLEDDLCHVTIRHSTLVPGWELQCNCEPKHSEPSLFLNYTRAAVKIEHSIVGAIQVEADEVKSEPARLCISDSIVDATDSQSMAISSPTLPIAYVALTVERSTIIGSVDTHRLELAENSIFDGAVRVARRQTGCVRFCWVPYGSRTPRRYECQPDAALAKLKAEREKLNAEQEKHTGIKGEPLSDEEKSIEVRRVRPQFNSKRYGSPTYCQLAETCAAEITEGAEDEAEMGVFHDLYQPQRAANLRVRLDQFTPAGLEAGIIYES